MTPADEIFAQALTLQLPADTLRPAEPRHLIEPRGKYPGIGKIVALPRTVQEVSVIVSTCNAAGVGIVPISGGTGLVGGQTVVDGVPPLLLSMERMSAIRAIHADENVIIAEAGAILADVQNAAEGVGRLFPLSLASEGTARIGGLMSTNAGGVNVLRYGTARDLCLGLEAVMADGAIFHGLRRLRKDNTGYDLRNLLIGAEGTLGIVTAASLKLYPRPAQYTTALLQVPGPAQALDLLALTQTHANGMAEGFELISGQSLRFLAQTMPDLRLPVQDADWLVLLELGLPAIIDAEGLLETIYVHGAEAGLVTDGVLARSSQQRRELWTLRESIPEANRRIGAIASHDISLPLSHIADFITEAEEALQGFDIRVNCFGHLGDGNLHFNVFPAEDRARGDYAFVAEEITRVVHDLVAAHDGSFSAEHGVGRAKVGDLERYGDPAKLAAMRSIKAALDPKGILNPGAVLRRT